MQSEVKTPLQLELEHFLTVVKAFQDYRQESTNIVTAKLTALEALPADLKYNPTERLQKHYELICHNQLFLNDIIAQKSQFYPEDVCKGDDLSNLKVGRKDHDKVRSTIRQFYREWSIQGVDERQRSFDPILQSLNEIYPHAERRGIRVLVPGAGLGRLPFEIASMGFDCQGNEFSFYMLLASNYILNHVKEVSSIEIYPWIHQYSNITTEKLQLSSIKLPDISPATIPQGVDFSMAGGDFIEVYSQDNQKHQWDCIVTCFFLDTAKNLVEYIQIIKHCLKENGKWINLGPLLYHFEGIDAKSVEFTAQELYDMVEHFGFKIEIEREIDSVYASCPGSLMDHIYHNLFFVAENKYL